MDYAVRASDLGKVKAKPSRWSLRAMRHDLVRNWRTLVLLLCCAVLAVAGRTGRLDQSLALAGATVARAAVGLGLVVGTVDVTGGQYVDEDTLLHLAGDWKGAPILSVDLNAIKSRIEDLGWVKEALVTRHFPDRLVIEIVERQAFALWQVEEEVWLIDESGARITDSDLNGFSDLPFIVGAGAPEAYAAIARLIAGEPDLAARVSSMVRVGERRWDVMFAGGARLRLPAEGSDNGTGGSYGPGNAWQRFAEMQREHQLLDREVAIYDMRLPDRMVVTLTKEGERDLGRADRKT